MRNNTLIRWAGFGLACALFLLACGPKKAVVSPEGGARKQLFGNVKRTVVNQVAHQQLQYRTFSGRAKAKLTVDGKDRYDVTAHVRIIHDEALWISVTAIMGVEVARVFITPDSIKVINRLKSEYLRQPFAYVHHFTGSGLDFPNLEQLLVGNVMDQLGGIGLVVWQDTDGYLLQKQVDDFRYSAQVSPDFRNQHTSITVPSTGQQLEAHYADYRSTSGHSFPNQMEVSISTPRLTL